MPNVFFLASVNVDILSYLDEFPLSGQTLSASDSVIACGGKGANQAYACSQNEIETTMLCKVGKDAFGEQAKTFLKQREQLDTEILESQKGTAIAQIFVRKSDSQNLIVILPGANKDITVANVNASTNKIENSNLLALQLENNIDAIEAAMKLAKAHNVPVLLNPAPYEHEIEPYLNQVDILTPNETEASELAGVCVGNIESARTAAQRINKKYGIKKIIITLGKQGAYYFDDGEDGFVKGFSADAVDTSGAGDAFNGAFASYYSKHGNFIEAIKFANAYASTAVEGKGASYMPKPDLAYERFKLLN